MENVIPFHPAVKNMPSTEPMTDGERRSLTVMLGRLAHDSPFPMNMVLRALAVTVRDYNLEDVQLKDLAPKGYVISANYPNFGLHWIFRLHADLWMAKGSPMSIDDVRQILNRHSKSFASTEFAGRFAYRFLDDLSKHLRITSVSAHGESVVVAGQIQHEQFPWDKTNCHYHNFEMVLSRHH
ncbi:hypothetical protein [Xanthomonas phage RTH11]|nr:hypothetical protein [Xanthomonas phage RTH11]